MSPESLAFKESSDERAVKMSTPPLTRQRTAVMRERGRQARERGRQARERGRQTREAEPPVFSSDVQPVREARKYSMPGLIGPKKPSGLRSK
jgi:hypothetical protein